MWQGTRSTARQGRSPCLKKYILTLVKTIRKTLFRTIVIGVKTIAAEETDGLKSEYSKDEWGFVADDQSEGGGMENH